MISSNNYYDNMDWNQWALKRYLHNVSKLVLLDAMLPLWSVGLISLDTPFSYTASNKEEDEPVSVSVLLKLARFYLN